MTPLPCTGLMTAQQQSIPLSGTETSRSGSRNVFKSKIQNSGAQEVKSGFHHTEGSVVNEVSRQIYSVCQQSEPRSS